jgi:hypothetical protein
MGGNSIMKKISLILFILFSSIQIANAQALLILLFGDKLSTETLQAGINASVSASKFTGYDDTDYRISWAFGAFFEIKLNDNWSLQPELTVKTPGGAGNMPPEYYLDEEIIDSLTTNVSVATSMNYITIPVYIKYKAGHWGFGLGPQIGYLTSATDTYSGLTSFDDSFTLDRNVRSDYNLWDVGVTGMIDYMFSPEEDMLSTRVTLKYYLGFSDILKDNTGAAVHNSIFLLSVGIPIGGGDDSDED